MGRLSLGRSKVQTPEISTHLCQAPIRTATRGPSVEMSSRHVGSFVADRRDMPVVIVVPPGCEILHLAGHAPAKCYVFVHSSQAVCSSVSRLSTHYSLVHSQHFLLLHRQLSATKWTVASAHSQALCKPTITGENRQAAYMQLSRKSLLTADC